MVCDHSATSEASSYSFSQKNKSIPNEWAVENSPFEPDWSPLMNVILTLAITKAYSCEHTYSMFENEKLLCEMEIQYLMTIFWGTTSWNMKYFAFSAPSIHLYIALFQYYIAQLLMHQEANTVVLDTSTKCSPQESFPTWLAQGMKCFQAYLQCCRTSNSRWACPQCLLSLGWGTHRSQW